MCRVANYLKNQIEGCRNQIHADFGTAVEWAQIKLLLERAQQAHLERCKRCVREAA